MTSKSTIFVLGFGSVGRALYIRLRQSLGSEELAQQVNRVLFLAPEISPEGVLDGFESDDFFSFHHCPEVNNAEALGGFMNLISGMGATSGDILVEVACRVDTLSIWKEAKAKDMHFCNTGYDVWGDQVLDLEGLDNMSKDPVFQPHGTGGRTSIFGFGMNPGLVNHFVSHGLKLATGLDDPRAAAQAFGLKGIIFSERDTQWAEEGSNAEAYLKTNQEDILFNTWSPGNFVVETKESTLLWPGLPEACKEVTCDDPTFISWIPSGPIVGFAAVHDETFTVQKWFDKEIPALFIYEAPPTCRTFLKGENKQHSSDVSAKLLTPKEFDLKRDGYDMLGVILLSENQDPYFCGLTMDVAYAEKLDPSRCNGPTPLQVTGGVWVSLQYILQFPSSGDSFPEDVPTDFVMKYAFPHAGTLITKPCPEALAVAGFFDPSAADAEAQVFASQASFNTGFTEVRASMIHGEGVFATSEIARVGTLLKQLPMSEEVADDQQKDFVPSLPSFKFNHSCNNPNAFVDRNRAVRSLKPIKADEEITVQYAFTASDAQISLSEQVACGCGSSGCKVGNIFASWKSLEKAACLEQLAKLPLLREIEDEIRGEWGIPAAASVLVE